MTHLPNPEHLRGPGRDRALDHALHCRDCRTALVSEDPSRIFSLLALEPIPGDLLEEVSRRVARDLDRPGKGGGARLRLVSAWAAAAALAATILLAALRLGAPASPLAPDGSRLIAAGPPGGPVAEVSLSGASDGSAVVNLTVGGTQVVMIFDGRIDL